LNYNFIAADKRFP